MKEVNAVHKLHYEKMLCVVWSLLEEDDEEVVVGCPWSASEADIVP